MYFRALSAIRVIAVILIKKDAVIGVRSFCGWGPRTVVVSRSIEVRWWSQWWGMLESEGAGRRGKSRKLLHEFWTIVSVE